MKKVVLAMCIMAASTMAHAKGNYAQTMTASLKQEQCSIVPKSTKVHKGSDYTVVSMGAEGCGGGNSWATYVQAFNNVTGEKTNMVAFPSVDEIKVSKNVVQVNIVDFAEDDARCCPSLVENHVFAVQGNKLVKASK